jgi:hypothetical protein
VSDVVQESIGRALTRSYLAAWNFGMRRFGITDNLPRARGLLIGEAPGPNTDPFLPLFPEPRNSAGGRLLKYADIPMADWIGKLVKMNLCDETWSVRRAVAGRARALAFLFDERNYFEKRPLRVLLLGARVARAWGCYGPFGYEEHAYGLNPIVTSRSVASDKTLRVAWIPHPSGKNRAYNSRRNQLRARRAVLWAIGERDVP